MPFQFNKKSPGLYPQKPETQVKKKFVDMAIIDFGIGIKIGKGHWPLGFRRKFPLALQLTHDNYLRFLSWLEDWVDPRFPEYAELNQENNMYIPYFGDAGEFTLFWWDQFSFWFLREQNRKINPLSLIFDPLSSRPRIYERAEKFLWAILEKDTDFQRGTVRGILEAYKQANKN